MYEVTVDKSLPNGLGNVQVAANGTLSKRFVSLVIRGLRLPEMLLRHSEMLLLEALFRR